MKKTKLLIALCLSGSMGFAQLVTNGGFESYNTLPTSCSPNNPLTNVNSWHEAHQGYSLDPTVHNCTPVSSSANVYYYNNSTGGNGSCEPFAAHSGNGFITVVQNGLSSGGANGLTARYETLYQPISSTLYASKKYLFSAYAYINTSGYVASNISAALTTNIGL